MTIALLLAAILSVADPAGDAFGNGTVSLPSAVVFRAPGAFDARHIEVLDEARFSFALRMDGLPNPWRLANGFSLPIIEVYLADARDRAGREELLPGSGMQLPPGETWSYAFRLSGDRLQAFRAEADGTVTEVTGELDAELTVADDTLTVTTRLPRPRRFSLYAMVGSYDPFSQNGWRPIHQQPGPWSLSSPSQGLPVLDVLAERFSTQQSAIDSGVLPEIRSSVQYNGWLVLTIVGALLGLLGVVGRIALRRLAPPAPTAAPEEKEEEVGERAPRYVPLALPAADGPELEPPAAAVDDTADAEPDGPAGAEDDAAAPGPAEAGQDELDLDALVESWSSWQDEAPVPDDEPTDELLKREFGEALPEGREDDTATSPPEEA